MRMALCTAAVAMMLVAGCGKSDESLAKKAGKKVGETLTDFATGVGGGVDNKLTLKVEAAPALAEAGLAMTVAKPGGGDKETTGKPISVYFAAGKPFKGALLARALNTSGQEIGRAIADVDLAADDAKYVVFLFPSEMDSQTVATYAIDLKK